MSKGIREVPVLYEMNEKLDGTGLAYFLLGLLNRIEELEERCKRNEI